MPGLSVGVPVDLLVVAVVAVVVVAMMVAVAVAVANRRRRREAAASWAAAHGWRVLDADRSLARRWPGTPFDAGSSQRTSELLGGQVGGRQALSFRYTYTTTSGTGENRRSQDHEHHVVAVFLPAVLPALSLTPESLGTKIATAFGGQDIRFESAQFNARWRVTSPDLRFAHDVLHPRTMERLLCPDMAGRPLRFAGDAVLTWTSGAPRLDVIEARVAQLNELIDAVPAYVWQDRSRPTT